MLSHSTGNRSNSSTLNSAAVVRPERSDPSDDAKSTAARVTIDAHRSQCYVRAEHSAITLYVKGLLDGSAGDFFRGVAELANRAGVPCTVDLTDTIAISPSGARALERLREGTRTSCGELRIVNAPRNIEGFLLQHGLQFGIVIVPRGG